MAQVELPDDVRASIDHILEYHWSDEERDFEENCGPDNVSEQPVAPDSQVFFHMQRVSRWLREL
jgi:hypothetical protein